MNARIWLRYLAAVLFIGCAGAMRDCASCNAENFGSDWVVVQMDMQGRAFRCWELRNTAIDNESHSDGIFWEDATTRNLVHISNLYNRVQVVNGRWGDAFATLGLTREACATISARQDNGVR